MSASPPLCSLALWESLLEQDSSATFFQSPAWHRIAAGHYKAESAPLLFDLPAGPACLPLLRDRRWGRDRYFSPFGTYTALLCPRVLAPDETTLIEQVLHGLNVHIVSSPFTRNVIRVGKALPSRVQSINLRGVDAAHPATGWERDARRRFRHARELGLRVRLADGDRDWADYTALYQGSLKRWGKGATSSYPPALLQSIRENIGAHPGFRLWLAERGGVIGAGFMGFYQHQHAALWHAAANADFFKLGAVQLLYHDIIGDATGRGFEELDLLGSGGLIGVEAFKASLGARPLEFDSYLNRTGLIGALAKLTGR